MRSLGSQERGPWVPGTWDRAELAADRWHSCSQLRAHCQGHKQGTVGCAAAGGALVKTVAGAGAKCYCRWLV